MMPSITSIARKSALLFALTTLALAACSSMPNAPVKVADGVLTGPNGMTLYTFDKDVAGSAKSVCNGPCATNWPPLMAADSDQASGDFSVVTRDDGKKQWAQKGKPLYYWAKDSKPGDKTGDGFNKVWQVAKP
jgi:predicted lipoprotein with Yx(FWY)xxD motif